MSVKIFNALCMAWFISILICLVVEGSGLSSSENRIINDLVLLSSVKVGGLVPIPAFNIYFFRGVVRILAWDYNFYTGGWEILRYFWMIILSPGAVWGISQVFAPVFANLLRLFR